MQWILTFYLPSVTTSNTCTGINQACHGEICNPHFLYQPIQTSKTFTPEKILHSFWEKKKKMQLIHSFETLHPNCILYVNSKIIDQTIA